MAEEEKGPQRPRQNQPEQAPKKPAPEQGSPKGEEKPTQPPPPENDGQKDEADKQKERLKESKQKAGKRLELKQEKVKNEEELRQIKENVETACQEPETLNLSSILEKGNPPQDQDLTLIIDEIVDKARADRNAIDNDENLSKWIMELDVAGADPQKTDAAKAEIKKYKIKLARRLGDVVIQKARKLDKEQEKTEEQIERNEMRRKAAEEYWRERLVEGELAPEDFEKNVKKPIPPIRGGQEITEETWSLYDESLERFESFPDRLKRLIEGVNDTAKFSPKHLTSHYIESVVGEIDRLNGDVPRSVKQELKEALNEKTEEIEKSSRDLNESSYAQREINQLKNSREYRALGYDVEDILFLEQVLKSSEAVKKLIEEQGYEEFQRRVRIVFDHLFDAAASNRLESFNESWNVFVQQSVREQIFAGLDGLINDFSKEELAGEEIPKVKITVKDDGDNKVKSKEVVLTEALETLRFRLSQEEELRKYNHNIHYVIRRRLPLEKVAEFAQSLEANSVDVLFLEDLNVQTACHFYIQELKKTCADEFWVMGTTWLGDNPQGQVAVETKVKEKLRDYARAKGQELTERDLNRLISLAAGTVFGITGEGFDILAQNKPPQSGSDRDYSGYFADNILPSWNIQHAFERFGLPSRFKEWLYIKVLKGGEIRPWSHKRLAKEMEKDVKQLKTGLLWSLSGGPPLMEVISRNFGIRGILSRGSWRFLALTSHHLVGKTEDGKQLPVSSSPIDWEVDDKETKDIDPKTGIPRKFANQMLWENIDWDKSFENLEKAGVGVMFSYWIDKRIDAEAGHDTAKKKELTHKYYYDYLWKTRNRNPLIFLRYDLAQNYKGSLRYRALGRIEEFKQSRENYKAIQGDIDNIERDLMMVAEEITRRKAWNDRGVDENGEEWSAWDVIPEGERREKAKKYWESLQAEIGSKDEAGNIQGKQMDEVYQNFFKEKYYFFGSEDMDFREVAMRESGFDVLKRAFGDINSLSKAAEEFSHALPDKLIAAARAKDYKDLIGSIEAICGAVDGVHGLGEAQKMGYYLTTAITRYFDKSWWARLPLGFGTGLGWITESSLAEKVGGKRAWQWDEQAKASFLNDVRMTGYLATEGDFSIKTLQAEVGARDMQAVYDILRTAIPLIMLLVIWQATKEETKN